MKKFALATTAMFCVIMAAACESPVADLDGENTCIAMSGLYTATEMRAVGTDDNTLSNDFLALNGSFTISFSAGNFTSNFRSTPGGALTTRTGNYVPQNGTITLGNQTLFTGAAAGNQLFACTAEGKDLTLIGVNTSFMFPGQTTAAKARITIELSKP